MIDPTLRSTRRLLILVSCLAAGDVLAQAASPSCPALPANALLWLSADETDRDVSAQGHDATRQNGATFGTGRVASGYQLDGLTQFVSTPAFTPGAAWTVEAWVRPDTVSPTASASRRLVAGGTLNCADYGFATFGDKFGAVVRPPGGTCGSIDQILTNGQTILGTTTFAAGTWYHVAATSDGATARLYVNGVEENSGPTDPSYIPTDQFRVGHEDCCNTGFAGGVDEATVYGRALTAAEIASIAGAGRLGKCLAPLPYLQTSDSPFATQIADGRVKLETLEDGVFDLPGVTLSPGTQVVPPAGLTDSVDGDDGKVDGNGAGGHSLFSCTLPVTATFSAPFPTAAGVVWTDGLGETDFQAFDPAGHPIAMVAANHADDNFNSGTAEDRFYGLRNAGGIGSLVITTHNNCIELDHIQAGTLAPIITSTFDTGDEGWRSVDLPATGHVAQPTLGPVTFETGTGNPAGDIQLGDLFSVTGVAAPAKFLGDRSEYYGGEIRYDIRLGISDGGDRFGDGVRYVEAVLDAGTFALYRVPTQSPGTGTFESRVVPLLETGWRVNGPDGAAATSTDMANALANLQGLYIETEYGTGGDDSRIDNVMLVPSGVADAVPAPFAFTARTGVLLDHLQVSESIVVTGLSVPAPISVSGGLYRINGGSAIADAGTVQNGDRVSVRHTSSTTPLTTVQTTLTIGPDSAVFASTTQGPDTAPDAFAFGAQIGVPMDSMRRSNNVRIRGINVPAPISVVGGRYSINGGAFNTAPGTVGPNDFVKVHHQAAATPGTVTTTTLTVGGVSAAFTSTTVKADASPDAFGFLDQGGVAAGSVVESNVVKVSGVNTAVGIAVSGGEYRVNGGAYTSASGTVNDGDLVQVRVTAPAGSRATASVTLTVGGVSDTFSVTTGR